MIYPPPDRFNPAIAGRYRDYRDEYSANQETVAIDESNAYCKEDIFLRHMRRFHQMPLFLRCEASVVLIDCAQKIEMPLAMIGGRTLTIKTAIATAPQMIRGFREINTDAYSLMNCGGDIEIRQSIPEVYKQQFIGRPIGDLIDCPILKATDYAQHVITGWGYADDESCTAHLDNDKKMERIKHSGGFDARDHYEFRRFYHDIYYGSHPVPVWRADREEAAAFESYRISKDKELRGRRIEKAFRALERSYQKNPPRSWHHHRMDFR